eukprot:scaffold1589_cov111-Isochrysis_galbana.AAC.15
MTTSTVLRGTFRDAETEPRRANKELRTWSATLVRRPARSFLKCATTPPEAGERSLALRDFACARIPRGPVAYKLDSTQPATGK